MFQTKASVLIATALLALCPAATAQSLSDTTGKVIRLEGRITSAEARGERFAVATLKNAGTPDVHSEVRVYDREGNQLLRKRGSRRPVRFVVPVENQNIFLVAEPPGSEDGRGFLRAFDLSNGNLRWKVTLSARGFAVSPGGRYVVPRYFDEFHGSEFKIIDLSDGSVLYPFGRGMLPFATDWLSEKRLVVALQSISVNEREKYETRANLDIYRQLKLDLAKLEQKARLGKIPSEELTRQRAEIRNELEELKEVVQQQQRGSTTSTRENASIKLYVYNVATQQIEHSTTVEQMIGREAAFSRVKSSSVPIRTDRSGNVYLIVREQDNPPGLTHTMLSVDRNLRPRWAEEVDAIPEFLQTASKELEIYARRRGEVIQRIDTQTGGSGVIGSSVSVEGLQAGAHARKPSAEGIAVSPNRGVVRFQKR